MSLMMHSFGRNGIFQRHCINQQLRLKRLDFLESSKPLAVVGEAHAHGVALEDGDLMLETQQVDEETSHLACAHN